MNNIPWISVKERVPKHKKDVIVWDKKDGFKRDYYSRTNWDEGWMGSNQDRITHWVSISLFNRAVKPKT